MSKGLEALKELEDYYIEKSDIITVYVGDTEQCEIIEKELKALEIIRKKKVNCLYIAVCKSVNEYNNIIPCENDELTQEEYDLLKEVLL